MNWSSWLAALLRAPRRRTRAYTARRPRRQALAFDTLESRVVPSAIDVTRASTDSNGGQLGAHSDGGPISGDGRLLVFISNAPALGAANNSVQVYLKDLLTGTLKRVSTDSNGVDANDKAGKRLIKGNGKVRAVNS